MRITPNPNDLIILHHYYPEMREAMAKFTGDEWTAHAAKVRVPCQPLLSPEEALQQQTFLDDGCVIEANGIRQVGQVYRMSANEVALDPAPAPEAGADTDAIVAEA